MTDPRSRALPLTGLVPLLAFVLAGCSDATGPGDEVVFVFDFDADASGWTADFTDFPEEQEDDVEFEAGVRELPEPLEGRALFQRGNNISDDLFMYFRHRVSGLEPGAAYRARFRAEIASEIGEGCDVGTGVSVFVKGGASRTEPTRVVEDGQVRLSVDKGNQQNDGANALLLGDIRNGEPGCGEEVPFATETVTRDDTITVTADDEGRLWLFLGTESAFEVAHELFFTSFRVTLEPVSG